MNTREVGIVGFAQAPNVRRTAGTTNGVEMLIPIFEQVYSKLGIATEDIGFFCSGSSDYLAGRAFSFIAAVDAIGAFPPINESHVEADAAWALYEAWLKIRSGEVDTALVYGFGKSSAGTLRKVLALQLDPYTVAPLWPDSVSLAGLQARAGLESGAWTERDMAEVAVRSRASAAGNPTAQLSGTVDIEELLKADYVANPLRAHDIPPVTDGASVVVLAAEDRARQLCDRPAWITGIDHRVDTGALGARRLDVSASTETAAAKAGAMSGTEANAVDVAELHTPFSHQELLLRQCLKLGDDVTVNPSGGTLTGNPMFAAGLARIGEAASQIFDGTAKRALAHATSGPLLQQNLVCLLEGDG